MSNFVDWTFGFLLEIRYWELEIFKHALLLQQTYYTNTCQ